MKTLRTLTIAGLWFLVAIPARADDAAEAKAIIEKAIKAAGGEAKLAKFPVIQRKGKGTFQLDDEKAEISYESVLQDLDKVRLVLEADISGSTTKTILVYSGDKGWVNGGGEATELPTAGVNVFPKEDYRNIRLAELLTPLRSKEYTLSPLGEIKVDGLPAVGVKIAQKDHADYDLFFDKESGLPVKGQTGIKEMPDSTDVAREYFFGGYKEVDGLKCLTKLKIARNGKRFVDVEWSEIKPLEKTDAGTFDKP